MNNMGSSSQTVENNLRKDIRIKENKIDTLQNKLRKVDSIIKNNKKMLQQISDELSIELQSKNLNSVEVTTQLDKVILIVPFDLLFRKKNISRITSSGSTLLQDISNILSQCTS